MILTVTLNAALDVTYWVDGLRAHASNRVRSTATRAGGKGVNVARVLHALGHDVLVTGFAGGPSGELIRGELQSAGVPEAMVAVDGDARRTVTVVDEDATVLLEPGPSIRLDEWRAFQVHYRELLPPAQAVVLSGSLPPGLPADAYATLGELAAEAAVPVVLDADGEALLCGLEGCPAIVKPNAAELAAVAPGELLHGAAELRKRGAEAVVVSSGPAGLWALTGAAESWAATPPERMEGNPTGAGDAVVAALAAGLVSGARWKERLADAVALSAAAVRAPLAGEFDDHTYRRLRPLVRVKGVMTCP